MIQLYSEPDFYSLKFLIASLDAISLIVGWVWSFFEAIAYTQYNSLIFSILSTILLLIDSSTFDSNKKRSGFIRLVENDFLGHFNLFHFQNTVMNLEKQRSKFFQRYFIGVIFNLCYAAFLYPFSNGGTRVLFILWLLPTVIVMAHYYLLFMTTPAEGVESTYTPKQLIAVCSQTFAYLCLVFIMLKARSIEALLFIKGTTIFFIYLTVRLRRFLIANLTVKSPNLIILLAANLLGFPISTYPYCSVGTIWQPEDSVKRETYYFQQFSNPVNWALRFFQCAENLAYFCFVESISFREVEHLEVLFFFVRASFALNIFFTGFGVLKLIKNLRNSQFEYLHLISATRSQISRIITHQYSIKRLEIDEIEPVEGDYGNGYSLLDNDDFKTKIMDLCEAECDPLILQNITISSILCKTPTKMTINTDALGKEFLDRIAKDEPWKINRQLKLVNNQNRKDGEFIKKLNRAVVTRLFNRGLESQLLKQVPLYQSTKQVIREFTAMQLVPIAFEQQLANHLFTNPKQVFYDLYD